jgi:addiction module RelE/StbE family toxin
MEYIASKRFLKEFTKLPKETKIKTLASLKLFVENPKNPALRKHALTGKWKGHFSIDVTGDIRAVYIRVETRVAYFVAIGSHSELYG